MRWIALILLAILLCSCGAAAIIQQRNTEDAQARTALAAGLKSVRSQCDAELASPALAPLRGKVQFWLTEPPPVPLLVDDTHPTAAEQAALIAFADVRKHCDTAVRAFLVGLPRRQG